MIKQHKQWYYINMDTKNQIKRYLPDHKSGMIGLLPESKLYLHLPSDFAVKGLFYAPFVGHFHCTPKYKIVRQKYDYYLFVLVESGNFEVSINGSNFIANSGEIVLINTKKPHKYKALTPTSFKYFHFDGSSSSMLYNKIISDHGNLILSSYQTDINNIMDNIINLAMDAHINEIKTSAQIHLILSELATPNNLKLNPQEEAVKNAIDFLDLNFTRDFPIIDLANHVNISQYYFSRLFKESTGMSPHTYKIRLRIALARQLLLSTNDSIEKIAFSCGFNSSQHFIRTFKQQCNCTPREFREKMLN